MSNIKTKKVRGQVRHVNVRVDQLEKEVKNLRELLKAATS